ncbi:MAG TPA: enoyl-CoA hydratase/isomerase family protein, partial [Blastocatellia bacterium]|nr:enoyl-CoA hydratase/isomerase family protein [Blastocatellia bacterium]
MPAKYENLIVETNQPIARITLNRPERRNALSQALMQELLDCLRSFGQSREVGAVILAASGNVFSSGHDLSEMRGRTVSEYRKLFE